MRVSSVVHRFVRWLPSGSFATMRVVPTPVTLFATIGGVTQEVVLQVLPPGEASTGAILDQEVVLVGPDDTAIDVQRRVTSKKLHKIETRNLQFRHQFEHIEKCCVCINAATSAVHWKHVEQHPVQSDMKERI